MTKFWPPVKFLIKQALCLPTPPYFLKFSPSGLVRNLRSVPNKKVYQGRQHATGVIMELDLFQLWSTVDCMLWSISS